MRPGGEQRVREFVRLIHGEAPSAVQQILDTATLAEYAIQFESGRCATVIEREGEAKRYSIVWPAWRGR